MTDARRVGEAAVRLGMLSRERLAQILAAGHGEDAREVFSIAGVLTDAQLDYIDTALHFAWERIADKKFGELVVERGWADRQQVAGAMEVQKLLFLREHKQIPIGEMLVRQRAITAEQRDTILDVQQRVKRWAEEPGAPSPAPADTLDEADGPLAQEGSADSVGEPAVDGFRILVDEDALAVSVVAEDTGRPPALADLKVALGQRGVVHGIDEEALERLAGGESPVGEPVRVASGTPPRDGTRTRIEYAFETAPLGVGHENEDGMIDFRDLGEIPQVEAHAVLARRVPGEEGSGGVDVFGKTIPPRQMDAPPLSAGTGTEQQEDGTIVAIESGHPRVTATGTVTVYPEYRIDGDLGYSTGHVDFHGRVVVTGTVQAGFRVRCGELVAKELEKADIEAEGDVFIRDGIMGARVRAGGSIKARFLREADVEALGDIIVEKEVVDSRLEAGGALRGARSTVLDSHIGARGGIFVNEVGSESSRPCRLVAGVGDGALHEAERLEAEADTWQSELERAPEVIEQLRARRQELDPEIVEAAQAQDLAQVELRELGEASEEAGPVDAADADERRKRLQARVREAEAKVEALFEEQERVMEKAAALESGQDEIREAIAALRAEALRLREWADANPTTPEIKVRGVLAAGTLLRTPHKEVTVAEDKQNVWLHEVRSRDARGRPIWKLSQRRS